MTLTEEGGKQCGQHLTLPKKIVFRPKNVNRIGLHETIFFTAVYFVWIIDSCN